MRAGYLIVQTSETHPGQLRLLTAEQPPPTPVEGDDPLLRYVARFNDLDGGLMHAHEALKRHLLDVDERLYHVDALEALADIEADELGHKRVYVDPSLADRMERRAGNLKERHRRVDRIWQIVGLLGILLLLLLTALPQPRV